MIAASRLHAGHAVLALLAMLALLFGWRARNAATAPLPSMPAVCAPWMTDPALLARFTPFMEWPAPIPRHRI